MVSNLKTISMSSSKLLLAAKALSTDPSSPNLKNQLAAAARSVKPPPQKPPKTNVKKSIFIALFLTTYLSVICLCRAVTDTINQLITMCTQQAPGQKECDNALRELEVTATVKQFLFFIFSLALASHVPDTS